MQFQLGKITDALERAGLLAGIRGILPETFSDISDDSRKVAPGSLFIAVKGSVLDGHNFLGAA